MFGAIGVFIALCCLISEGVLLCLFIVQIIKRLLDSQFALKFCVQLLKPFLFIIVNDFYTANRINFFKSCLHIGELGLKFFNGSCCLIERLF